MPQSYSQGRKASGTALLLGAALSTIAMCAGTAIARAGDDDTSSTMSSSVPFYDKVLQTIGVESGSNIQYNERSPLVVPPTRDLPPPVANAPPRIADWPKDPDMTRRAKAKAAEKPKPHPDYVIESSRPLTPGELKTSGPLGGSSGGRDARADPEAQDISPAATEPNHKSMFSFNIFNKTEFATFTGEPARTSLTDPPPGYQTPSPDQPYGIGPAHKQYKIPTVADRATPISGTAAGN
jgi:hypothetical protein